MIGDELAAALPEVRRHAESRMTSRLLLRRKTGATVIVDGKDVAELSDVYVDLPCWVDWEASGPNSGVNVNVGAGVTVTRSRRVLKIPHHATACRDHDIARISGGALDGKFFRLTEVTFADHKKQQEIPIIESPRPEGWT
ncbi:MAG TPA: DUF6093 family protein [Nocardioides sp.]